MWLKQGRTTVRTKWLKDPAVFLPPQELQLSYCTWSSLYPPPRSTNNTMIVCPADGRRPQQHPSHQLHLRYCRLLGSDAREDGVARCATTEMKQNTTRHVRRVKKRNNPRASPERTWQQDFSSRKALKLAEETLARVKTAAWKGTLRCTLYR